MPTTFPPIYRPKEAPVYLNRSPRQRKRRPVWQYVALILGMGLLAFRLYLPTWVKDYVNTTLARIPDYYGQIHRVRLHLWRGAYSIQGLDLLKKNGRSRIPFLSADEIDFSVQWKELFHRRLVGSMYLDSPRLNFVTAPSKDEEQVSIDRSWVSRVQELFPLKINAFEIHNGEIHFRNYEKDPHVNIFLQKVEVDAHNLTNSLKVAKTLMATIQAEGQMMQSGHFTLSMKADPYAQYPTFDLACSLRNVQLPEMNSLFKRYLAIEVQQGNLQLYTEDSAKDGAFTGYVKPMMLDVHFVHLKPEKKSVGEVVKGVLVKIAAFLFKNQTQDQLAAKIPLSGRFDNPNVDLWSSVGSFLRNAFIRALAPGFEGDIDLEKAQEKAQEMGLPKGG